LNYRLTQACGEVLKEVCVNVCPDEENMDKACGGTVLRCLADKIDDINDDTCKQELLYFQKMEVSLAGQVFSLCVLCSTAPSGMWSQIRGLISVSSWWCVLYK
jgi:Golgi apparatus protein 1